MKKTLFLILSGAIVIFSVICICTAPIINKVVDESPTWQAANCQLYSDQYKHYKDLGTDKETLKYNYEKPKNECNRKKAMYGLEYSALIIDVTLGFVCLILGLLHYFDIAKPLEKITGIIGLSTGIIQFILTMVYLCYSSYIFTNDVVRNSSRSATLYKRNSKWAFAEWDSSKSQYKCLFYKKDDRYAILAKYSDLGKKQYNYNKEKDQATSDSEFNQFTDDNSASGCSLNEFLTISQKTYPTGGSNKCENLYLSAINTIENKYVFDRWITTIIFSCFIIVCDIGLSIFGFLLFKSDGSGL